MSKRLSRDFLKKWGPWAPKLQFQGRKICTLGASDLRALLAYEFHRDAALNAALTDQTCKLAAVMDATINAKGLRGWLIRWLVVGKAAR